jgi:hypothetical protein
MTNDKLISKLAHWALISQFRDFCDLWSPNFPPQKFQNSRIFRSIKIIMKFKGQNFVGLQIYVEAMCICM